MLRFNLGQVQASPPENQAVSSNPQQPLSVLNSPSPPALIAVPLSSISSQVFLVASLLSRSPFLDDPMHRWQMEAALMRHIAEADDRRRAEEKPGASARTLPEVKIGEISESEVKKQIFDLANYFFTICSEEKAAYLYAFLKKLKAPDTLLELVNTLQKTPPKISDFQKSYCPLLRRRAGIIAEIALFLATQLRNQFNFHAVVNKIELLLSKKIFSESLFNLVNEAAPSLPELAKMKAIVLQHRQAKTGVPEHFNASHAFYFLLDLLNTPRSVRLSKLSTRGQKRKNEEGEAQPQGEPQKKAKTSEPEQTPPAARASVAGTASILMQLHQDIASQPNPAPAVAAIPFTDQQERSLDRMGGYNLLGSARFFAGTSGPFSGNSSSQPAADDSHQPRAVRSTSPNPFDRGP